MKLGNIIYENEIINHVKSEIINYYDFNDKSIVQINNNLPTLIIGWNLTKKVLYNSSIHCSILEKRIITNRLYWEHSFEEDKEEYTLGISNFIDNVGFYYNMDIYKYINLDPLFFQVNNFDELKAILPKEIEGLYQYKNDMIYILKDNNITGIDLNSYCYYGFNTNEIITHLKSIVLNKEFIFIDNDAKLYNELRSKMQYFNKLKTYTLPLLILNKNS